LVLQQSERFDRLDRAHKQIATALVNPNTSVHGDLQAQMLALSLLLDRAEAVVTLQEGVMRRIIVDVFREIANTPRYREEADLIDGIRKEDQSNLREVQSHLLKDLRFPTITDRFEAVAESHPETCQWIFQKAEETDQFRLHGRRWDDFVGWLQRDSGMYWINGKAGSGKSTLMKYIFNAGDTRQHLALWVGDQRLYIAGFFFWSGGSKDQRSQAGLYRSLLYDILKQVPELIPIVLPKQWSSRYNVQCQQLKRILVSTSTIHHSRLY